MFRNSMPRYELLSEDALATLFGFRPAEGWSRFFTEHRDGFFSPSAAQLKGPR